MREQRKYDDVFNTVETREKDVMCLTERPLVRLVDPQRQISQLMYVNISKQNMRRWCRLRR